MRTTLEIYSQFAKTSVGFFAQKAFQRQSLNRYFSSRSALRNADEKEIPMLEKWAVGEGWNPGKISFRAAYNAYPESFYILTDEKNNPVGSTTITRYTKHFAFLGLLIVKPEERKKGYGLDIWEETRKILKGSEIQFYGVMHRVPLYAQFGILPVDYNLSFVINKNILTQIKQEQGYSVKSPKYRFSMPKIQDIQSMARYEQQFFVTKHRAKFIESYYTLNANNMILATNFYGKVTGYGAIEPRFKENTFVIRSLCADDYETAREILRQLLLKVPNSAEVSMDIPSSNPHLGKLIKYFWLEREKGDKNCDTALMHSSGCHEIGVVPSSKRFTPGTLEHG
jgi:hypothetical protein